LLFADAEQLEATRPQVEVPRAVVLEGGAAAVVEVAVGFDNEPPIPPEEID